MWSSQLPTQIVQIQIIKEVESGAKIEGMQQNE
jgi:hypothetical protein